MLSIQMVQSYTPAALYSIAAPDERLFSNNNVILYIHASCAYYK